jgi:hypothetical protein
MYLNVFEIHKRIQFDLTQPLEYIITRNAGLRLMYILNFACFLLLGNRNSFNS